MKMNIELKYHKSVFSFDVEKRKAISYIKDIASKVFNLEKESVVFNYDENQITNTEILIKDFFLNETKATLKVEGTVSLFRLSNSETKSSRRSNNKTNKKNTTYSKQISLGLTSDTQNTTSIQCFKCTKKEVKYYCRQCDIFMCSGCKSKILLHEKHKLLLIQNGNFHQTTLVYKKQLIDEIKQMEKEFNDSKIELPDSLFLSEVQDFELTVKNIISKKNDICLKILPINIKSDYFEVFVSRIFAISSIEKETNENIEGIYKQIQTNEKEIETIKDDIVNSKLKKDFKQTVYTIIKQMNITLENTLKDLTSIYQTAIINKYTLIENVEQFIKKCNNNESLIQSYSLSTPIQTTPNANVNDQYQSDSPTKQYPLYSPTKHRDKSNLVLNYQKFNNKNKQNDQKESQSFFSFPKIDKNISTIDEISEETLIQKKVHSRSRVLQDSFLQRKSKTIADAQINPNDFTSNDQIFNTLNYKGLKSEYETINESLNSLNSDQIEKDYFMRGNPKSEAAFRRVSIQRNRFISDMNIPSFLESIEKTRHYIPIDPYKSLRTSKKRIKSYVDNVI